MMYDNAVDQVKGMKTASAAAELPFHLAKVTSLSNGRPYVQFYGESTPSSKLYPYLEGYKPKVNDDVLMLRQGSTYIIAGKISKDDIEDNYYLLKSAADLLYLTEAAADERYAPKDSGKVHRIFSTDADNAATLGFYQDSNNQWYISGWKDMSQGTKIDLGKADGPNSRFAGIYCDTLGGTSSSYAIQTLNVKDINTYGHIIPKTNKGTNLGSSSYQIGTAYTDIAQVNEQHINSVYFGSAKTRGLVWDSTNGRFNLPTGTTFSIGSGTSNQLNNVYAKQFYQNGTAISTSDKRKKKSIKDLAKQYIEFFKNLRPRTFKFKDGESDRTHTGFIAQEVEEAAGAAEIDNKDLAFLCIDKDGSYGLRYEELIAVQTAVIQDLLKRVEVLEIKVNGRSES